MISSDPGKNNTDDGTGKTAEIESLLGTGQSEKPTTDRREDINRMFYWTSKHGKLLYVIGITIFFIFYEVIKTLIWPHMNLWESHVISIIMVAVLSTFFISWFRQIYDLQNQELRTVNKHLLHDITERKQAENELRFSEERFSKAFNDCPSPMSISTFPDGRYVDVNEAFLQVLGYRREEVIGFTRSELHIWEKPEDLARAMQCIYENKSLRNVETTLRRKSGELRIGLISADIIDIRGGEYILAVFEDITERKEAEEALRQSEERFFKAFHSSPCGMSITNLSDFRIIDVNQHWLDATGCSREEAVGKLRDEIDVWTKQQCQQVYDLMAVHGSVTNLETVFRNKEGGERNCLWSGEIITLDGNQCLLTAIIDITERKQMDREMARLDRLNLMGQIAGSIAHEIRNPMTVVKGYLQLIHDKEEFASQKKRFDTMIGEIDRADAIITEFLSLAKIKPEEMKRQNINGIVDDLLPLIQADAAKRQVAISVELADVPDVNLDEKEIRQLFLNLVRNGIEAMPQLYGELMIKTFRMQDQVVLSIKDRGNGIPPEVLEKLGTPFFSTKEKGTGLGLPVCYRIAESHNARIKIETGKSGTTFMVRFPIPSPQDEVSI